MLIHRDVLEGVLNFTNQAKSDRTPAILRDVWVSLDGRWLVAANGRQVALGALVDVPQNPILTGALIESSGLRFALQKEKALKALPSGYLSLYDFCLQHGITMTQGLGYPDPAPIIEAIPISGGANVASKFAIDGPGARRLQRAFQGQGHWIFSRDRGTWFISAAVGRPIGDLRVLTLASWPAGEPDDIPSWRA